MFVIFRLLSVRFLASSWAQRTQKIVKDGKKKQRDAELMKGRKHYVKAMQRVAKTEKIENVSVIWRHIVWPSN